MIEPTLGHRPRRCRGYNKLYTSNPVGYSFDQVVLRRLYGVLLHEDGSGLVFYRRSGARCGCRERMRSYALLALTPRYVVPEPRESRREP